jgi:hypothetical protein
MELRKQLRMLRELKEVKASLMLKVESLAQRVVKTEVLLKALCSTLASMKSHHLLEPFHQVNHQLLALLSKLKALSSTRAL